LGFAGFRVQFVTNWKADVAAFLGAAYFRAVGGDTRQYGLSARATGGRYRLSASPRSFPTSPRFWFERPAKGAGAMIMYALMDSPSIAGALRFQIAPGGSTIMDIDSALYPRRPIERLGHRAADEHVLLRRGTSGAGSMIGGPRFTTRMACRFGTATANGFGGR